MIKCISTVMAIQVEDSEFTFSPANHHIVLHGNISDVSHTPSINAFHNNPCLSGEGIVVSVDENRSSFILIFSQGNSNFGYPEFGVHCIVETEGCPGLFP